MIFGALGELALGESSSSTPTLYPISIASAEAWGEPTLTADVYTIFPDSIDTVEAWGSPSIEATIEPSSIDTAEAFGSPSTTQVTVYKSVSKVV